MARPKPRLDVPTRLVLESELEAWAAITRRHIALEKAARELLRTPKSPVALERLRRALARRVRP